MARARASSPPPRRETAGLPPAFLKGIFGILVLLVGAAVLWRFNSLNNRLQAERRLKSDPVLGSWFSAMQGEIGEFERTAPPVGASGGTPLTEAVWLGTISHRELDSPADQRPTLLSVTVSPAYLLAGRPSPKDPRNGSVQISVHQFSFPQGEPNLGERWVFSVRRINGGNNVVRDAHPVR